MDQLHDAEAWHLDAFGKDLQFHSMGVYSILSRLGLCDPSQNQIANGTASLIESLAVVSSHYHSLIIRGQYFCSATLTCTMQEPIASIYGILTYIYQKNNHFCR